MGTRNFKFEKGIPVIKEGAMEKEPWINLFRYI